MVKQNLIKNLRIILAFSVIFSIMTTVPEKTAIKAETLGVSNATFRLSNEPTNDEYEFVYGLENVRNIVSQDVIFDYDHDHFELVNVEVLVDEHYHIWNAGSKKSGQARYILSSVTHDNSLNGDVNVLKLIFRSKRKDADVTSIHLSALISDGNLIKKVSTDAEAFNSDSFATIIMPDLVEKNEEFSMTYQINDADDLVAQQITIAYDPKKLKYLRPLMLVPDHYHIWGVKDIPGQLSFVLSSVGTENKIDDAKNILEITFKTNESVGQTAIAFSGTISNGIFTQTLKETIKDLTIKMDNDPIAISRLVEKFIASDDIHGPIRSQLTNTAQTVEHHYEKKHMRQAIKHLEKLLKTLNKKGNKEYISPVAKDELQHMVTELLNMWKNEEKDS